jgi:hypothetical protein
LGFNIKRPKPTFSPFKQMIHYFYCLLRFKFELYVPHNKFKKYEKKYFHTHMFDYSPCPKDRRKNKFFVRDNATINLQIITR